MEYELYIDVYFLLNFVMNYVILTAAKRLLRNESSILRRTIGAGIGSISVCISMLFPIYNKLLYISVVYIIPSIIMTIICYKPLNMKQFRKQLLCLYVTAFLLGGSMLAIYNLTNVGYYIAKLMNEGIGQLISLKLFLILSLVGSAIVFGFTTYKCKADNYDGCIYTVELQHNNKTALAYGLVDTGNSLRDPISKRPVIICEKDIIEKVVSPQTLEEISNANVGGYEMFDSLRDYRVRMIPYNAVGNTNGMLVAITIDNLKITYNQNSITLCETLVAVYDKKLSQTGEFQMLLQPELLKK